MALVPPEHAPSDVDSSSEPENEEEIAGLGTEELSSSPCPSIDSQIERMNLLDSPENYTQDNTSIDSDETYFDPEACMEKLDENFQIEDRSIVSDTKNVNPVSEVEVDLNNERPPLTPIMNRVLPPNGDVNYNALPSLASLLSVSSPNPSSIASPPTSRTTRLKRKLLVRAVPNVKHKKPKKTVITSYKWKKGHFKHKADIPSDDFVFGLPDTDSPLDFFHRYFSPDIFRPFATIL